MNIISSGNGVSFKNIHKVSGRLIKVMTFFSSPAHHFPPPTSIILCSGQGSQYVGMLKKILTGKHASHLYRLTEVAHKTLGYNLLDICLNGPEDVLQKTVHCQPAILLASLLGAEILREEQPNIFNQNVQIAGYSVGEIAALVIAGSLTEEQAFVLIKTRAEAMQFASDVNPSRMLFLNDVKLSDAEKLCEDIAAKSQQNGHNSTSYAGVAADILPNGCTIGVSLDNIGKLQDKATEKGFGITLLPVSGAFHTPLMSVAQESLSNVIEPMQIKIPNHVTYSNVTAEPYQNEGEIKRLLVKQLVERVQWQSIMKKIFKKPEEVRTYELGPGRQLKPIVGKFNRSLLRNYSNSDA